jgi:SAM-dependent methyltransferase
MVKFKFNLKSWYYLVCALGFDVRKLKIFVKGIVPFCKDFKNLKKQLKGTKDFPLGTVIPIFSDRYSSNGSMKGAYFHQDLLIAKRIFDKKPIRHIDIGSRTDGFISHIAVFRKIEIFDIRKNDSNVENIIFQQADLMNLPQNMIEVCDSISSLHAIEHFGLGRYSDPIDLNGHIKAIQNIYLMLKPKGVFYFSVPIGEQRIEFNAHRVFSLSYLLSLFEKNKFQLDQFHYVNDQGDLFKNIILTEENIKSNLNCTFGCGIFELIKN